MPCVLKENEGIPKLLLIIKALATGFSVANCYYNQSLLGSIVSDFHASEYDGSIISALTQFGYVVGLCIVIPLGNTLSKKRIITIQIDKLSSAGYISVEKGMSGNRPRTLCSITEDGIKAFEEYVDVLKSYLNL